MNHKDTSSLPSIVIDTEGNEYRVVKPTVPDPELRVRLEFIRATREPGMQPAPRKNWEGCRACYGSGGKRSNPCTVCNGTGKLPKGSQG